MKKYLDEFVRRAGGIHGKIAKDVFPGGAVLRCTTCGAEQQASQGNTANYLRSGWPKCCGYTMRLESRNPPGAAGEGEAPR